MTTPDQYSTYKTKSKDNANKTELHLRRKGARSVINVQRDNYYEVQYWGSSELVNHGRHGLPYDNDEVSFILLSYLSGLPIQYISSKTKRSDTAIKYKLKSFGLYAYNPDDCFATDLLKTLGWMVTDRRKYSHDYSDSFLPGTSQDIIENYKRNRTISSVETYSKRIPSAKRAINELRLATEDAWKLFHDIEFRRIAHNDLVECCAKKIITRCDLFNSELFAVVCNSLECQNETIALHAIMRHWLSGRDMPNDFNVIQYMATFTQLELYLPVDGVKEIVSLRLICAGINNIIGYFYRKAPINLSLTRYISSVLDDDYNAPVELGYDFKEGFRSFLESGILPDFVDDPSTHTNTFLRWVKIFNIKDGGYDSYMYSYLYADNSYPEGVVTELLCNIILNGFTEKMIFRANKIDAIRTSHEYDFYRKDCCYPYFIKSDEDEDNNE